MKKILLAILLSLSLVVPVSASPSPLTIQQVSNYVTPIVEQQSPDYFGGPRLYPETWVRNPTPCAWDVDDTPAWSGFGYLNSGASVNLTTCIIADGFDNFGGDAKMYDVLVSAPSNSLVVTVADNFGHVWPLTATSVGREYRWTLCHLENEQSPWESIADSNGGTGRRINYTLTITAVKKIQGLSVHAQEWGIGFYRFFPSDCPYP